MNSVDEIIYTEKDPVTNLIYENYYVLLGGSGNNVYVMRFRAPQADFSKYYSQFQSIVSSVTIANQVTTNQVTNQTPSANSTNVIDSNAPGIINPDEANSVLIATGIPADYGFSTILHGNVYDIDVYDTNGNYMGAATLNAQNGQILSDDINVGG